MSVVLVNTLFICLQLFPSVAKIRWPADGEHCGNCTNEANYFKAFFCIVHHWQICIFRLGKMIIFANETCNAFACTISLMTRFIYRSVDAGWLMSLSNNLLIVAIQNGGTGLWLHSVCGRCLFCCVCKSVLAVAGSLLALFPVAFCQPAAFWRRQGAHCSLQSGQSAVYRLSISMGLSFSLHRRLHFDAIDPFDAVFCEMIAFQIMQSASAIFSTGMPFATLNFALSRLLFSVTPMHTLIDGEW